MLGGWDRGTSWSLGVWATPGFWGSRVHLPWGPGVQGQGLPWGLGVSGHPRVWEFGVQQPPGVWGPGCSSPPGDRGSGTVPCQHALGVLGVPRVCGVSWLHSPSLGTANRCAAALTARTRSACAAMSASTSAWICSRSSTPCRCFPKSCDCSRPYGTGEVGTWRRQGPAATSSSPWLPAPAVTPVPSSPPSSP